MILLDDTLNIDRRVLTMNEQNENQQDQESNLLPLTPEQKAQQDAQQLARLERQRETANSISPGEDLDVPNQAEAQKITDKDNYFYSKLVEIFGKDQVDQVIATKGLSSTLTAQQANEVRAILQATDKE